MKTLYVGVNIDWSKSFVDQNGAFYCGTTEEQKNLAAELMPYLDLVVNTTDFHSINSKEFVINGGMWPLHNVAEFRRLNVEDYKLKPGITISPEQTELIDSKIKKEKPGMIVSRHVYFQDGFIPSFNQELVEEAFSYRVISPEEFIEGDYDYIISPKTHFDATTIIGSRLLPKGKFSGIPDEEFTVFDLIQEKYHGKKNIVYVGTGVVDNICRHYTSAGLRQKYGARVINVIGATTELYGIGLGFTERNQTRLACERIQKDIGIEHKTLDEVISEIK